MYEIVFLYHEEFLHFPYGRQNDLFEIDSVSSHLPMATNTVSTIISSYESCHIACSAVEHLLISTKVIILSLPSKSQMLKFYTFLHLRIKTTVFLTVFIALLYFIFQIIATKIGYVDSLQTNQMQKNLIVKCQAGQ